MDKTINVCDLYELNKVAAKEIWDLKTVYDKPNLFSPRLIIPKYSNGGLRISEQEARFIFTSVLDRNNRYYYSIETPTQEKYSFSGNGKISAQTDLSLYLPDCSSNELDKFQQVVNIEFKAANCDSKSIYKDIQKLVKEQIVEQRLTGNWFHLLNNSDSGTLPALFNKFKDGFKCLQKPQSSPNCGVASLSQDHLDKIMSGNSPITILFTVCIYEKKKVLIKCFNWPNTTAFVNLENCDCEKNPSGQSSTPKSSVTNSTDYLENTENVPDKIKNDLNTINGYQNFDNYVDEFFTFSDTNQNGWRIINDSNYCCCNKH